MSNERPVNPDTSTLTEGLKRKRGRPKKQPQEEALGPLPVKKPRGRPKGSKKVTAVSGQMVGPSAGKRPRGRPRKWASLEKTVPGPAKLLVLGDLLSNILAAAQYWIQNTGAEEGFLSSKVWKILINRFGEGMKSVGNLQISLEVCF
ncbi:uncharacterized protein LOC130147862 isoform X1 [Falco biarmicus]|uniref:uncharacterized protein LOC114014896 isoform X2 n=2 Tax=Falco cherrug TaxID=345164 RepID=UPI002478868E|nr:uncharacterized protein LOC114014896 isoform X2 [Falco cherrug]XP_055660999.1 uncharacterized protein LOC114011463 isoform X1 [Falco peregrinus]XP_055661000.1 uncharacterized protein LOC114011463 isoform X1 [Falco peregrinus]XP_055661002.1 uncharacterized protein LOC114011463 isoform X1 [Falco peregrinus]XP_056191606.1 uncharacterized protein LOC130147862 isoform X1 [Falco biarmicus]XP_056191607.1 uncharacterized protein LOC130147862 isoform X1 [Falco biarmicus]XP_056191608.1 uncharacteriz